MATGQDTIHDLVAIDGVSIGISKAGIRYSERDDLVVFSLSEGTQVAGVFTKNAFCAAPVTVAKAHLESNSPIKGLVINTGNANAGTGQQGMEDCLTSCHAVASHLGVSAGSVLPFSTGVIGEHLKMDKFLLGIPDAINSLSSANWNRAASAILTTDTRPKGVSKSFQFNGQLIHITGITKGSGMIRPNMATMLAFVATNAPVSQDVLQQLLAETNETSFNRITVDGDTSTNDANILIATGQAKVSECDSVQHDLYVPLKECLQEVMLYLATAIVKDGEGASKFVTVHVEKAVSKSQALTIAYSVAHSPLVKTALAASDANWGRILAAVGYANVSGLDIDKIQLIINDVLIVDQGGRAPGYKEESGAEALSGEDICIQIILNQGQAEETVYTTDLTHEYVSINADYRS